MELCALIICDTAEQIAELSPRSYWVNPRVDRVVYIYYTLTENDQWLVLSERQLEQYNIEPMAVMCYNEYKRVTKEHPLKCYLINRKVNIMEVMITALGALAFMVLVVAPIIATLYAYFRFFTS